MNIPSNYNDKHPLTYSMESVNKKTKKDVKWSDIHGDLFKEIVTYLPVKDLLSFELAQKGCSKLTVEAWKSLSTQALTWSDCEKLDESSRFKANFMLSEIFKKYSKRLLTNRKNFEEKPNEFMKRTMQCYSKATTRFPLFNSLFDQETLEKNQLLISNNAKTDKWTGDVLLKLFCILVDMVEEEEEEFDLEDLGMQAVQKKITFAANLILYRTDISPILHVPPYLHEIFPHLSITLAAAKQGDFKPLELFISNLFDDEEDLQLLHKFLDNLLKNNLRFPPILKEKGNLLMEEKSLESKRQGCKLFDEMIQNYGEFCKKNASYSIFAIDAYNDLRSAIKNSVTESKSEKAGIEELKKICELYDKKVFKSFILEYYNDGTDYCQILIQAKTDLLQLVEEKMKPAIHQDIEDLVEQYIFSLEQRLFKWTPNTVLSCLNEVLELKLMNSKAHFNLLTATRDFIEKTEKRIIEEYRGFTRGNLKKLIFETKKRWDLFNNHLSKND